MRRRLVVTADDLGRTEADTDVVLGLFADGAVSAVTLMPVAPAAERVKVLLEFLGRDSAVDVDLFSILLPRRPMP